MYGPLDKLRIPLGRLGTEPLHVVLSSVYFSDHSFEVLCFLNLPEESERHATEQSAHWIATQSMYGSGPRLEEPPTEASLEWHIDVEPAHIEKYGNTGQSDDVLTLIVVEPDGSPATGPWLRFGHLFVQQL